MKTGPTTKEEAKGALMRPILNKLGRVRKVVGILKVFTITFATVTVVFFLAGLSIELYDSAQSPFVYSATLTGWARTFFALGSVTTLWSAALMITWAGFMAYEESIEKETEETLEDNVAVKSAVQ